MKKKIIISVAAVICMASIGAAIFFLTSNLETWAESEYVTLGEYKGIQVEAEQASISDTDIEQAILEDLSELSDYIEVSGHAVTEGDIANIDYIGTINGYEFNGGSGNNFDLEVGSGNFIEGFEDELIGLIAGDSKDIEINFPNPYTINEELSGQTAVFSVTVNSVKIKEIPDEITDSLIQEYSEEFSTVNEYWEYKKETLTAAAEEQTAENIREAVWIAVMDACIIKTIPEDRIDAYASSYKTFYQSYADMLGISLSEYLATYLSTISETMTEEKLDENLLNLGELYMRDQLVAETIAEKEGIKISNDEYRQELELSAADKGMTTVAFEEKYGDLLREDMILEKVMEFVSEQAVVTLK